MVHTLEELHDSKKAIIVCGTCWGVCYTIKRLNISKLELFQHLPNAQYIANATEQLLMATCRNTFIATSHQCFKMQIIRWLASYEKCRLFHLSSMLRSSSIGWVNQIVVDKDAATAEANPEAAWLNSVLP